MLEGGNFPEGVPHLMLAWCAIGRKDIDGDQLVLDTLLFKCEPDRSHVNAIRRTENNRMV